MKTIFSNIKRGVKHDKLVKFEQTKINYDDSYSVDYDKILTKISKRFKLIGIHMYKELY